MKAVIIDDDPAIVTLLSVALKRKGYQVSAYSNPNLCPLYCIEACPCDMGYENCPNIIITDFMMPEVSGMDFIKRLKQKGCLRSHIAMMSGYLMYPQERELMVAMGATFLAKPFRLSQINEWLDKVSGKSMPFSPPSLQ
ncbi:MAG: response regulator [bacterium]